MKKFSLKVLFWLLLLNGLYVAVDPLPLISRLNLYNTPLVAGRLRLPYSRDPASDYSANPLALNLLFASHEIAGSKKTASEYRVILLGDSSVWGWRLNADQTLSACLNRQQLMTSDGRAVKVYNLGYPLLNVTKDLLILERALTYHPDMVVWLVTLESLYPALQLNREIIHANTPPKTLFDQSIIGQRKLLADWWRLQVYGLAWQSTGIDHRPPEFFAPVRQNLQDNTALLEVDQTTPFEPHDLALEVLETGATMTQAAGAQFLLVNEPIYRSTGANSHLRYNFYYPKWAYDSYRSLLDRTTWDYLDLWDTIPSDQFTDSSFHLTPVATCDLATLLAEHLTP